MATIPTPAKDSDDPENPHPLVQLPVTLKHCNTHDLIPYERNPRTHTPEQIAKIAASLLEYGWTNPILVDGESGIIAGHGRLLAARELGMETVPVIELSHLTEAQKRAYVIADNRLALDAGWDEELLTEELRALEGMDFDLAMTGFELDELHGYLEDEEAEEVSPPEPPEDPVTRPGDLWLLGDHRLLCGDSGKADDVDRLLDGAPVHLVNTDPPYNVKVEPRSKNAINAGLSSFSASKTKGTETPGKMQAKDRPLLNDYVTDEVFEELLDDWFGNLARVLEPGRSFYIWGGYANVANYPPVLKEKNLYFSQWVIWDKQHPVLTRKDFMGAHEVCFYGWREGAGHKFYGPANIPDLWPVKKVSPQSMVHLTEKPVELAVRAIHYSSKPGENVLDLFGGSGSTLMAAEETGRNAFLMEMDPAYCDVIVQRWQAATGTVAKLVGTGQSFEAIEADRQTDKGD
jgi:DNA modification methylase